MPAVTLAALERLLSELFTTPELRRFLAGVTWGVGLGDELPGDPVPKAEGMHQAAALLHRRGLVTDALWTELKRARPSRSEDIDAVAGGGSMATASVQKPVPTPAKKPWRPIRLLHLSDLHFSSKRAWDQDPVLAGLARDVAGLREQVGGVDLVVVTGDIADSGAEEEYRRATDWLSGPLSRAAGMESTRIRVVPGNHDVDRSVLTRAVRNLDRDVIREGDEVVAELLRDGSLRAQVLPRQANFTAFARRFHPGLSDPWWRIDETIQGWRLRLYGLNTAWLSGSHRDESNAVSDLRHLAISALQWNTLFEEDPSDSPDLCIALMHHPWEDLADWDRRAHKEATFQRCGVVLRGHLHDADTLSAQRPGALVLELAAGACYADPREGWPHGYQLLELDPGRGEARIHLRKWHARNRKWIADNERYPDGTTAGVATLPLRKSPRAHSPPPPTPPPAADDDPESRLRDLVAERIGDLPAVFELPGQRHAASEVYVELALSPESLPQRECGPNARTVQRIEDALDHPVRRWVLCGEAGCGKTTLLHHLADTLLKDRARNLLPVPLRVAELQRGDRLADAVTRAYDAASAALVSAACADGRAVVLLDGLDEAVHPEEARAAVQSLAVDAGKGVLILSSRDTAYQRPGASFGELRVLPLSDPQQVDLLSRWVGEARARAELAPMSRRPRLARMAKNPLLLTLMGLVLLREGGSLPAKRAELYDRAVGLLLRSAHRPERALRFDDPPLVREVLSRLALTLHGQEQTTWPLSRLCEVIEADPRAWPRVEKRWKSADRFLDDVAHVSDLLVPEGPRGDPRGYRFPHRTFREHLASVALADDLGKNGLGEVPHEVLQRVARGEPPGSLKLPPGELNRVLKEGAERPDIWAEVLALTAGALGEGGPDRLVRRVAAAGDRRLLLRVVADADGLQTDTVDAALALERGWNRWEARKKILEDLPGLVGDPAAVVALLRRFVASTTDGNDLYWAREGLRAIAAGSFPDEAVEQAVRDEAAEGVERIFEHLRNLDKVQAMMKPRWKPIPAGSFQMGKDQQAEHTVTFASRFAMLAVPVTWAMYRLFDPGQDAARRDFSGKLAANQQEEVPVYNVSWYAATMFADWVGARLPLEPEWEYACRAGTTTRYWSGETEEKLSEVGWYGKNSGGHPHAVGKKPANPWGLHDVHGNIWEWCQDWYEGDAYKKRAPGLTVDPAKATYAIGKNAPEPADSAASRGDFRVLRGGSWDYAADYARSADRGEDGPSDSGGSIGFRLVLPVVPSER